MYQGNSRGRSFGKRSVVCFFIIMLLFLSCILRLFVITTGNYLDIQKIQSGYKLKVSNLRGTIYDKNKNPITNNYKKTIASIIPTPRAITGISSILSGKELEDVLDRLKSGKPVTCVVPKKIDCDGISYIDVFEHNSSDTSAIHLIGYTDSDGHGVSGLELAYDDLLYCKEDASFMYTTDGRGNLLEGIEPEISNNTTAVANGIVTTLDMDIQSIIEQVSVPIKSGAVLVCEADSGKIRGSLSLPTFDCKNITEYLNAENSPLMNRALSAFNVGSVFKPCVAAAGIENGHANFLYTCEGGVEIADRIFKCHNKAGHGLMDLKSALANSCNSFFYNFAFETGANEIYNTAASLNFGKSIRICDNLSTAGGNLPSKSTIENKAQLANLSIGQGELLLSPISMLTLYCSIASDGKYYIPSVVEGTVKNGSFTAYDKGKPTKVMEKSTADTLKRYLEAVITEGTGTSAKPDTVTAAGKTATAQTGKFVDDTEICQGWFCGFFPADKPKYVVIVFSENIAEQSESCGEIFAEIADRITALDAVDK